MMILLSDVTTETCYLDSVCELENEISATDVGFSLRLQGFDDKILDLAESMLNTFFSFRKDDSSELPASVKLHRFEACLEILCRRYRNAGMKATSLCSGIRLRCLRPNIWSCSEKVSNK